MIRRIVPPYVTYAESFDDITDEIWRDDFDQKLFAAIRLTRLVWPQMKERRWGRVINTTGVHYGPRLCAAGAAQSGSAGRAAPARRARRTAMAGGRRGQHYALPGLPGCRGG